jgi:hypothetical protein
VAGVPAAPDTSAAPPRRPTWPAAGRRPRQPAQRRCWAPGQACTPSDNSRRLGPHRRGRWPSHGNRSVRCPAGRTRTTVGPRLQAVAAGRDRCAVRVDEASSDKRLTRARPPPIRYVRPGEDGRSFPGRTPPTGPAAKVRVKTVTSGGNRGESDDMLELQGLTRRYGDLVALDGLSVTVARCRRSGSSAPTAPARPLLRASSSACWSLTPAKSDGSDTMMDRMSKRVGHMAQDHGQTFPRQCADAGSVRMQRA